MVMTVRLPLRSNATCDALLVSFESLPATKKPQKAWADAVSVMHPRTTSARMGTPRYRKRVGYIIRSDRAADQLNESADGAGQRRVSVVVASRPGASLKREHSSSAAQQQMAIAAPRPSL